MAIPLWGAVAYGGKLMRLDDASVGADSYVDSSHNNPYTATLNLSQFSAGPGTYSSLRRLTLNVESAAALVLTVQGRRDGQDSGVLMTRNIAATDAQDVIVPQKISGTIFEEALELSGWPVTTGPTVSLGKGSAVVVTRRSSRGGDDS